MTRLLLNVGSGDPGAALPSYFSGWRNARLDISPQAQPDILLDARELHTLPPATYDAVYCAHNLEHYYLHDAARVVRGFIHVLKPDGFVEIRLPDIQALMRYVVSNNLDVNDAVYTTAAGPVRAGDVIYGFQPEIEQSRNDFYAHKWGFSPKSLQSFLLGLGFAAGSISTPPPQPVGAPPVFEVRAVVFKQQPTREQLELLKLPLR